MDKRTLAKVFAQRVKDRRQELGYTQLMLSIKSELPQPLISKYERGDVLPTAPALVKLARALNTTTDYLVGLSLTPQKVGPSTPEEVLGAIEQLLSSLKAYF